MSTAEFAIVLICMSCPESDGENMITMTAEALKQYGIDFVDAMDRFDNNAELYQRLALKYLNDTHYDDLVAALEVQDYKEAYAQAHSLKGVAGNLSFTDVYDEASLISRFLFEGEAEAAEKPMPALGEAHKKVIELLEKVQDGEFTFAAVDL